MPKGSKADKRRIQIESELRERHPEWGADFALLAELLQVQRGDGLKVPAERVGRERVIHLDLGPHGRDGQGVIRSRPRYGHAVEELEGDWAMRSQPSTNGEYDRARELIESLGREDQEYVWLRFGDQLTLRQMASRLGVSHTAVAKRLRRVVRDLRRTAGVPDD